MNRFSLRTYFPATVDSTLVEGKWQYDTTYHRVPDFQFTSHAGNTFSQKNLEGKLYVANFFYTSCQSPCVQVSTQLSRVQDAFRLQPDVRIVSFSLRPQEDYSTALKQYAQSFRADPSKWIFLTGEDAQIQNLVQNGYRLPSLLEDTVQASTDRYTKQLLLVDKDKHIRGVYDGTDATDVDRLITEINVLLSEYNLTNGK
ncbi:SCO family protein [Sabulibacter ruber]|uniref:SCO family protein n=1 Tax=Sabulibacter ruber TaxID=2811901 RepID=UPI001A958742